MSAAKKTTSTPTTAMHLRLGRVSSDALDALKATAGVVAVVLHTHGKKGEHPHWHVWIETGAIIAHETMRKRLRKHDVFKTYSGNEDWSIRHHDSYDTWSAYVMKNPTAEVLYEVPDDTHPVLPPRLPIVASASEASAIAASYKVQVVRPKRSKSMKQQFHDFLKEEGWEDGCINYDNLTDKKRELVDLLTEFWSNAFTTPQGAVCIQFALWEFANAQVRDMIKAANYRALESAIRI